MCKMSNVRLSNGSPTLERVDARQMDHTKFSVCRNLFGSVDHEELRREFEVKQQEITRAFAEEWSYDISKDEPLSQGAYKWEAVKSSDLPEFYSRPPHTRVVSSGNVDLNGNHDYGLSCPASGKEPSEDSEKCERKTDSPDSGNGSRKRHASQESSECGSPSKRSHTSEDEDGSESVEHTPSKTDHTTEQ